MNAGGRVDMHRALTYGCLAVLFLFSLSACSDGGGGKSSSAASQGSGWSGTGIGMGSAIQVLVLDEETGLGAAEVQVIASRSDGTDLVSAETNAAGVAVLQGFDEVPSYLTVVDPAQSRNITFYGNEQFPLRTNYTLRLRQPATITMGLVNPPDSIGNGATLGLMVNGTDVTSSLEWVNGVPTAAVNSGNAWTKGQPVMFMAWWTDDMTGELLDVHYHASFTGFTDDVALEMDLSAVETYRDDLNGLIGRADWTDPPEPEPEPDPDDMDMGGMDGMDDMDMGGGSGMQTSPMEMEPELVQARVWGDVLVPTRENGVDISFNNTYVWLELKNSFGTWRVPGSFDDNHAANTRFVAWYPTFDKTDPRVRMTPSGVSLGLGFTTQAPAGDIALQIWQGVQTGGRAPDCDLSGMVLDDAAVEVTLNGVSASQQVMGAQANLIAKLADNVTIRSSATSSSAVLTFPWLTGVSQAPLAPTEAVLVSGWNTVQLPNGQSQGIAYAGQDSVALSGDFNLDGGTTDLTADLSALATPTSAALQASVSTPMDGGSFTLGQDHVRWTASGIEGQEGFFTLWLGGDLGGDPMTDLEWRIYVPKGATETQSDAEWAVTVPLLTVAPIGHQAVAANDSVSFEVGYLDVTRSQMTASQLDLDALAFQAARDMDYIGRNSAVRSIRLPVRSGVDLQ